MSRTKKIVVSSLALVTLAAGVAGAATLLAVRQKANVNARALDIRADIVSVSSNDSGAALDPQTDDTTATWNIASVTAGPISVDKQSAAFDVNDYYEGYAAVLSLSSQNRGGKQLVLNGFTTTGTVPASVELKLAQGYCGRTLDVGSADPTTATVWFRTIGAPTAAEVASFGIDLNWVPAAVYNAAACATQSL